MIKVDTMIESDCHCRMCNLLHRHNATKIWKRFPHALCENLKSNFKINDKCIEHPLPEKLFSCECQRTSLMIRQHKILVHVLAWCCLVTKYIVVYDVTRPQCTTIQNSAISTIVAVTFEFHEIVLRIKKHFMAKYSVWINNYIVRRFVDNSAVFHSRRTQISDIIMSNQQCYTHCSM